MCLSSNACYNAQFGVTYVAGCTDKNYKDGMCPDKGPYYGRIQIPMNILPSDNEQMTLGSAWSTVMEVQISGWAVRQIEESIQ